MTISTISNKAQWQGNGATSVFSFSFEIGNANEASLYLTAGGTTTLIPPSSYSISGLGAPNGGTITYPLSGSPIASGSLLTLFRTVPLQQLVDLVNQSNYFPDAVEGALDYEMMAIQQLALGLSYAIQAPPWDPSTINLTLPGAATRADTLAGFDINGNVTTYPITASVGAGNMTVELGQAGTPGFKAGTDFTAGVTTTLNLSKAYGNVANVFIAFDGTYQARGTYSLGGVGGTQLTFNAPIPVGTVNVDVVGGTSLSLYVPPNGTVGDAQLSWGNVLNRTVDSIAALRALSSSIYTRAFATGYYATHDGGGGPYQLDPSDTTSADNGGTIIVAADGGRWKLQSISAVSLKQFGAKFDGATVDSAAIQAAFTWLGSVGGGELYAPAGTSIIGSVINWTANAPLRLRGAGAGATIFQSNSTANASIFNIAAGTVELSDIGLYGPTSAATAGTLLTTVVDHKFNRIDFVRYFNGASLGANVGLLDGCHFGTEFIGGPVSTSSRGVIVSGYAGGLNITNCVAYVPTVTPFCGINIVNSGAVQISNSNIIRQGTNVLVNPGNGQGVASLQITNCYLDSAQNYNLQIAPGAGGLVTRTYLNQVECSSAGASGIQINGASGTVDGVLIVSSQANFCGGDGITVLGANAKNIDIVGGQHAANAGAGISANSGASVRVTGVRSGSGYGGGGNADGFSCDSSSTMVLKDCVASSNNSNNYAVQPSTTVLNCDGFTSANSGASQISSGGTSVVVSHGLSGTPGTSNIQISPQDGWGSNNAYVDPTSITSSSFTVRCASSAAGNLNFAWRATCNGQQ